MILPDVVVLNKIYVIRGQNVMTDNDLAELYQVETKRINEQVKRNLARFPEDFMFRINEDEFENLKSHSATSSWGGRRNLPYVFTEHGILMLSSVLSSERAITINIQIMRMFIKMRELLLSHKDLFQQIEEIRKKLGSHDDKIEMIYQYLKRFRKSEEPIKKIGFKQGEAD